MGGKQVPQICGMFLLDDNKELVDFLVTALGKDRAEMEAAMEWVGWRVSQKGDKINHDEIFSVGGMSRTFALGEEFDSSNDLTGEEVSPIPPLPGGRCDERLPGELHSGDEARQGPPGHQQVDGGRQGAARHVLRRAALLLLLLLQDPGHHGGRRVATPPVQGKWRLVAVQGLEAQMAAVGMSKAEADKLKDVYIPARSVTTCHPAPAPSRRGRSAEGSSSGLLKATTRRSASASTRCSNLSIISPL